MDTRIVNLAKVLVNHSVQVKKGDKIIIDASSEAAPLVLELYRQIISKGAFPITKISIPGMAYSYFNAATQEQLKNFPATAYQEMKGADGWIGISSAHNLRELTRIDSKKLTLRGKITKKLNDERLKKKWVIVAFPTNSFAQEAEMSLYEFEDFVFKACLQKWNKIGKRQEKIRKELQKAKKIRILTSNTDVTFSNEGRKWISDYGRNNMPGGEIFTAPVEKTVEGHIKFDFPALTSGKELAGIYLEFHKGKIVKATAEKNQEYLKEIIKTDKGSSYIGECGIGLNYKLKRHVKQILFDEKIGGTIHLAIGAAYKECNGVNKSSIHLDLIKDMRKDGKLFADGKLIQKNGKFLI